MGFTKIIAAAAAPLALTGVLLSSTAASTATTESSSDMSAYYWHANANSLCGPQDIGPVSSDAANPSSAQVVFSQSQYLAKVTMPEHNADLNGKTITITGHLDASGMQHQGNDPSIGYGPHARLYFIGTGGSDGSRSQLGFYTQSWWADASSAVLDLSANGDFTLTATVSPDPCAWSDWNGQLASGSPTGTALFQKAASHVRELGLSFGGGYFFENGVTGTGGLTITNITVSLERRARAFGVISGMGGIGAATGPLIGGAITAAISWRAAFIFQALIIVVIVVLARGITDPRPADPTRPFDAVGAILSAVGLVVLVGGIMAADQNLALMAVLIAAGAAILAGFFAWIRGRERAGKEALLSTGLFRNRTSNLALVTQNVQWAVLLGTSFVVSAYRR